MSFRTVFSLFFILISSSLFAQVLPYCPTELSQDRIEKINRFCEGFQENYFEFPTHSDCSLVEELKNNFEDIRRECALNKPNTTQSYTLHGFMGVQAKLLEKLLSRESGKDAACDFYETREPKLHSVLWKLRNLHFRTEMNVPFEPYVPCSKGTLQMFSLLLRAVCLGYVSLGLASAVSALLNPVTKYTALVKAGFGMKWPFLSALFLYELLGTPLELALACKNGDNKTVNAFLKNSGWRASDYCSDELAPNDPRSLYELLSAILPAVGVLGSLFVYEIWVKPYVQGIERAYINFPGVPGPPQSFDWGYILSRLVIPVALGVWYAN